MSFSGKNKCLKIKALLSFETWGNITQWDSVMFQKTECSGLHFWNGLIYYCKSTASYMQQSQKKKKGGYTYLNNGFHHAKFKPHKHVGQDITQERTRISLNAFRYRRFIHVIWCRTSHLLCFLEENCIWKKTAFLEGRRHHYQLVSCNSSTWKPADLNWILYWYVIKHLILLRHVKGSDTKWKIWFCR
jgi:hypothetical protein